MKLWGCAGVLALVVGLSGCGGEQKTADVEDPDKAAQSVARDTETKSVKRPAKRYGYESGVIRYKSMAGEETVYFDDWGAAEARYSKNPTFGGEPEREADQITIMNDEGFFVYDVAEKTGTRTDAIPQQSMMILALLEKDLGQDEAKEYLERHNIKRLPDEEVLGFPCEVYQMMGSMKAWVHQGIMLKWEQKAGKMTITQEAVSFEPHLTVDAAKLRFPEGVDPDQFPGAKEVLDNLRKEQQSK